MWPRSAPKMGCPRRKRRAMESVTSRIGTNSAINGATMPKTVAALKLQMTPKHPRRNPSSKLPESPRKTVAGLKL